MIAQKHKNTKTMQGKAEYFVLELLGLGAVNPAGRPEPVPVKKLAPSASSHGRGLGQQQRRGGVRAPQGA